VVSLDKENKKLKKSFSVRSFLILHFFRSL